MRKSSRTAILALLCGSTAITAIPSEALAGPMSVTPPSAVSLTAPTVEVHYYRHWGYRHHWGYYRPHYYRHWGYYRPHYYRHWGYYRPHYYRHWGYYRPYYRHWGYYRRAYYPGYGYYGYNPAGALFGTAALGLMGAGLAAATAPAWGLGWGPGWGWGGWW
jgi:hypothetical protein